MQQYLICNRSEGLNDGQKRRVLGKEENVTVHTKTGNTLCSQLYHPAHSPSRSGVRVVSAAPDPAVTSKIEKSHDGWRENVLAREKPGWASYSANKRRSLLRDGIE